MSRTCQYLATTVVCALILLSNATYFCVGLLTERVRQGQERALEQRVRVLEGR